jgi:maleate cis-trans isomerase
MIRHFGVLIPSTNTTVEIEYTRLLPPEWQAHYGRLMSSNHGASPFASPLDEDVAYQAKLLGTARVEIIGLIQTSACLFADDYDETTCARITENSGGIPAITSAMAIGEALRAMGARHVALVSPYSEEVNEKARRYFETKHDLKIAALEGFAAKDSYMIGKLGPENARDAFRRIDRPEIEAFVVPGGNFPTMMSIPAWEREFKKPVVTTNQAALWAMLRRIGNKDRIQGLGKLLEIPVG